MKPPPVKGVKDARPGVTGCWWGSLTAGAPLGLEFPLLLWLRGQCPRTQPSPRAWTLHLPLAPAAGCSVEGVLQDGQCACDQS